MPIDWPFHIPGDRDAYCRQRDHAKRMRLISQQALYQFSLLF